MAIVIWFLQEFKKKLKCIQLILDLKWKEFVSTEEFPDCLRVCDKTFVQRICFKNNFKSLLCLLLLLFRLDNSWTVKLTHIYLGK